jgi:pimeloyl-ACP methyl ester carboxylesterase
MLRHTVVPWRPSRWCTVSGTAHGAAVDPGAAAGGHDIVAPDLPSEDGSASFDDYADVVCAALADREDVVHVGHSFGGHTIPLVADRRPVRRLVYLSALVPDIGRSLLSQTTDELEVLNPLHEAGLSEPD